jgi:hypothetical protein
MTVSRVDGTRKDIVERAELLDVSQALKLRRVDKVPTIRSKQITLLVCLFDTSMIVNSKWEKRPRESLFFPQGVSYLNLLVLGQLDLVVDGVLHVSSL